MHIADALLDLSLSDLRHFARIASRSRNSTGIFLYVNAGFNQWHDRPTLLSRVRLTFVYFSPFEHAILPRYTFPIDSRHATYDRNMHTFTNRRIIDDEISIVSHCRNGYVIHFSLVTCLHVPMRGVTNFPCPAYRSCQKRFESVFRAFKMIHAC